MLRAHGVPASSAIAEASGVDLAELVAADRPGRPPGPDDWSWMSKTKREL